MCTHWFPTRWDWDISISNPYTCPKYSHLDTSLFKSVIANSELHTISSYYPWDIWLSSTPFCSFFIKIPTYCYSWNISIKQCFKSFIAKRNKFNDVGAPLKRSTSPTGRCMHILSCKHLFTVYKKLCKLIDHFSVCVYYWNHIICLSATHKCRQH